MPDAIDDTTIPDLDRLYRRVPSWHVVWDNNKGQKRPSSAAFENDEDGMSVSLESVLQHKNLDAGFVLIGLKDFALQFLRQGAQMSVETTPV